MRMLVVYLALLTIAALWLLGVIPLTPGYLMVRIQGWQLETSLAGLMLMLGLTMLLGQIVFSLWGLPGKLLGRLRIRSRKQRQLSLLGDVLEGNWEQVRREVESDTLQEQVFYALSLLHTGKYSAAVEAFKALENVHALRPGARLNRARSVHRHLSAKTALELMDSARHPSSSPDWTGLRLELLADLKEWKKLKSGLESIPTSQQGLTAQRRDELGRQARHHTLMDEQKPETLLELWQSIEDPEEANQQLAHAVGQLVRLHRPDMAAALLATELAETSEAAMRACFLLPPGAHCRAPLVELQRLRTEFGSSRALRGASTWLALAAGETEQAVTLLVDWSRDRD